MKTVFAAAPAITNYNTRTVKFTLNTNMCYTNTGKTIQKLQVNFGQGFIDIVNNQVINYTYSSDGEKQLTIKAKYTDNSEYECKTKILINTNTIQNYGATPVEKWLTATNPNAGGYGCRLQILYGCGHTSIVKPLIVAEGFNPSVLYPNEPRGLTIEEFIINTWVRNIFDPITGNRINIDLDFNGYDIIYVDYNEGGGDIVKNAWMLREVIQWVNAEKLKNNSAEKNIVLGQSMGGLVARYALRKMEQLNEDHQTSTYISFDSPHLGANMPLGFQQLLSHLNYYRDFLPTDQANQIKNAWTALRSTATKQMLLYYVHDYHYETFTPTHDPAFTALQTELQNMGLPINCKTIAVANGNSTGNGQGFQPNDLLLALNSNGDLSVNMRVWALPDNNTANFLPIYDGYISIRFFLFTLNLSRSKYVNYTKPYDSSPGGVYDLNLFGFDADNLPFPATTLVNSFCFVPTVSALAITSEINNPYYAFGSTNITPTGLNKTLFQKTAVFEYYANSSNNNDPHTFFTYGNDGLLRQEAFFPFASSTIAPPTHFNSSTYTFGVSSISRTVNRLSTSYTITNNSKLNVNTNSDIGYTTNGNTNNNSDFTLEIVSCNNGVNTITVQNGGRITIGDGSNRKGMLVMRNNTQLNLQTGSELVIENGSNIILDKGATIVYAKGAIIKLLGSNSTFIAKHGGKIQIGQDAVFNYSGDGFIKFETAYPYSALIEAIGPNAQFKVVGGAFGNTSKKVLEITGGEALTDLATYHSPGALYNLALFSVQNGYIELSQGSRLIVSGTGTKADFRSVDFRASTPNTPSARHRGLIINGQQGNVLLRVSVSDAINGVQSNNVYGGANVDILQYTATRCNNGLLIWGKGARIQDAEINNCTTAIRLEGMDRSTRLYRTKLYANTNGIYGINCTNNVIELYQPNIYNNYYGVYGVNSQFAAFCGTIKNNAASMQTNGVYLGGNVYLTQKSNLIIDPVMRVNTGRMDLSNTISVAIRQNLANIGPFINQSGSSLLTNSDFSIFGTIDAHRLLPAISLNAENNLWGFTNNVSRSPINLIDYDVKHMSYQNGLTQVIYNDNSPISQFTPCGAGSNGGSGGDDRMRGWIAGEVTPIRDLPDLSIPDGRMIKETVQEAYNQFFDIAPEHSLAVENLTMALNSNFTSEDIEAWGTAILLINSQLIEALGEGIEEGNISLFNADSITYSNLVSGVIELQDKLLNDFINDNQNIFAISIAKASLLRMLNDRDASIQVLNGISSNLYPDLNPIKESMLCMTSKEKLLLEGSISPIDYDSLFNCSNFEDFSLLPPPYIEENPEQLVKQNDNKNIFASNPLNIYPNPTNGLFSIKFKGEEAANYQITILDIMGKVVDSYQGIFYRDNKLDIDLSSNPSGIYFIKMTTGNDSQVSKIILTK